MHALTQPLAVLYIVVINFNELFIRLFKNSDFTICRAAHCIFPIFKDSYSLLHFYNRVCLKFLIRTASLLLEHNDITNPVLPSTLGGMSKVATFVRWQEVCHSLSAEGNSCQYCGKELLHQVREGKQGIEIFAAVLFSYAHNLVENFTMENYFTRIEQLMFHIINEFINFIMVSFSLMQQNNKYLS